MGFSRQEYQSRLLCPSSKDLPKPENKSESLQSSALAGGFFITSTTWDVPNYHYSIAICQQTSMWSSYGFSSSHVWMCELDHKKKKQKKNWPLKDWRFSIVMLEKTHESLLACKEIKSVNSDGNQSWIFIEIAIAEAEAPVLWPHDAKS